jgi:superfamily I DNA/RNA helicase
MDAWRDIRLKARASHAAALAAAKGERKAAALVAAALALDDLQLDRYEPGTKAGAGVYGFLDRPSLIVNVLAGQDAEDEAVVIAHEIAHFKLHLDPRQEVTVLAPGLGGDAIDTGSAQVQGYSPRERKEVQADVFAGEFLCPSDWLREEMTAKGRKPAAIAEELGLPPSLVMNQAIRALLLPPLRPPPPAPAQPRYELDPSQREAAMWTGGPLLVDAGPGTGKTRTLVYRIGHLLETGAPAASILALTFSNKAAEEMRERLSASNPQAAIEMWAGTFHAFGLELVSKWYDRLGRTINVRILDETGALALLEENLERLPLRHFQNLYEPAFDLTHILRAISRCKDEMITPEAYRAEAEAALLTASGEAREVAEKALEVAQVYAIYEDALRKADAVDFGDLVMLSARLLETHPDVAAETQARFEHLLVDEYQDVNLASARLLRALAKPGADVWVVADQRQSIYRFRGAEPSNVTRFPVEFSGARRSLQYNYRSGRPVVRAFETFANRMETIAGGGSWTANRGDVGGLSMTVAPTLAAEAAAIRQNIEQLRAAAIPYSDQAILARSHLTLGRVCGELERLGVPLLYLGDLFERPEIRDLLSLLAIDAEFGGVGLVRVAQLPVYGATKDDALMVLKWAAANGSTILQALGRLEEIEGLSEAGRAGLTTLAAHLAGMGQGTSPWTMLTTWLFERSGYLAPLLAAADAKSQQKLIAIYQLLKVCSEHAAAGDPSRRRLLQRIRRIEALNDERIYRAVSSEASDIDAVRVMTVHGSKGLEFGAVHIPALATRYLPSTRQGVRCPPPPTLPHLAVGADDHAAQEECLFFVALSRARDHLSLSRAERYTTQAASASKFLPKLAGVLPPERRAPAVAVEAAAVVRTPPAGRDRYEERELALYMRCPARYRYEVIDELRGDSGSSPYVRFHRCVYRTIGWLEEQKKTGAACDRAGAAARLHAEWQSSGPVGHGFEGYYRASADGMVAVMADAIGAETGTYDRDAWAVDLGGKAVVITPDRVLIAPDGRVRIQRVRTGRRTLSEPDNPIYALLRLGASQRYPGRRISIETFYPATGEAVSVPARKDDKLLADYRDAIAAIERGEFPAKPEDARQCPSCPYYFMCGS